MTAKWLSDDDGPVPLTIVGEADEISYREGGENATQDRGREGLYSRLVSIGILGDFTESGGKLAWEPARLRGNGLTDDSLAPLRATVWPKERPRALRKLAL
jgi:hypothetical protein